MADDKDQNGKDDFDALDEDFELDLFDEQQDQPDQKPDDEQAEVEVDFDEEIDGSLEDDFTDSLDDDVIELSDEDVAAEFAAMEQEEAASSPSPRSEPQITSFDIPDVDDEADEAGTSEAGKEDLAGAAQISPDTSTSADDDDSRTAKPAIPGSGLPPFLAPLATLSPRMIAATTAAVLLPLVIFAVLGLNNDPSDAEENASAEASPFVDPTPDDRIQDTTAPSAPDPVARTEQQEEASAMQQATTTTAVTNAIQRDSSEPTATDTVAATADNDQLTTEVTPGDTASSNNSDQSGEAESGDETLLLAQVDDSDSQDVNPAPALEPEPAEAEAETTEAAETEAEETESVTETTAPMPGSSGSDSDNNYHIIVASFATQAIASQHAEQISDAEITAYVIPPFGSASNYRVAIAGYRSMAQARENIAGLRAVYGEGIWPLRYPPAPGIPLISQQTGDVYVIVASFPNETLARSHADGLVQQGEQPAILAPYPPANRYRVAVSHYDSLSNAENALPRFRENYGEDAWLLRY